jgi:hypothetical protein
VIFISEKQVSTISKYLFLLSLYLVVFFFFLKSLIIVICGLFDYHETIGDKQRYYVVDVINVISCLILPAHFYKERKHIFTGFQSYFLVNLMIYVIQLRDTSEEQYYLLLKDYLYNTSPLMLYIMAFIFIFFTIALPAIGEDVFFKPESQQLKGDTHES